MFALALVLAVHAEAAGYFDCNQGANNWQMGWSPSKKQQCCQETGVGCETGSSNFRQGQWDCAAGANNWVMGWSEAKKEYCCRTKGIGCSGGSVGSDNQYGVNGDDCLDGNNFDEETAMEYWKGQMNAAPGKCHISQTTGQLVCDWRKHCQGGHAIFDTVSHRNTKLIYDCDNPGCQSEVLHGACCGTCDKFQNAQDKSSTQRSFQYINQTRVHEVQCNGCEQYQINRRLQNNDNVGSSSIRHQSICRDNGNSFECIAHQHCNTGRFQQEASNEVTQCTAWPCNKCWGTAFAHADCCHTCLQKAMTSNSPVLCHGCAPPAGLPKFMLYVVVLLMGCMFCCLLVFLCKLCQQGTRRDKGYKPAVDPGATQKDDNRYCGRGGERICS